MKNGIVILGNGFDLFHGHKTSYKDFIQEVKKTCSDNIWVNYFDSKIELEGWVDIENEFYKIINSYSSFKNIHPLYNHRTGFDVNFISLASFLGFSYGPSTERYQEPYESKGVTKYHNRNKLNFTLLRIKSDLNKFLDEQGFLLYPKIDKKIIQDFRELKTLLQNYIKSVVKINEKYSEENSVYKTLNNYDNLIVINFNYTNTLSFYNSNIINVYVHGSVDDEIIFGHNEINDYEFSMFNKHVQTQISATNYKHLLENAFSKEKFDLGDSFDLLILGHSFDSNDFGVFKWVYETFYSHKFIFWNLIYFYYPSDDNWDLISRNSNLNKFYTKYLNAIVNTKSSLYYECLEQRMINPSDTIYTGHHEFDFFQRVGNIKKIPLQ